MQIVDLDQGTLFVGGGGQDYAEAQQMLLKYGNRHGLIAGATGTGKTVTLQVLAEGFSMAGVPVFLSDVKGDLSGIAKPGSDQAKTHQAFTDRSATIGLDLEYRKLPVTFWDIWGEKGHPVRTTPAEMGPLLLSRLLDLTAVQEGVMNIAFRIADEQGLALADLKDLQAMLVWLGQNAAEISLQYGNVSTASVGAIQRALLVLENQGGGLFFAEPALELSDLIRQDAQGRGMINVLAAEKLMSAPRLYATFLLWLMSELFEQLPEVGDPDKPVMAFFFDEAHLLFNDAPKALLDKIEQVVRLIRSKGVGVYFITQNPTDVPDSVLSQLGNRVQHALRAFTAKDQKALRQAAQNYRANPDFDTVDAIQHVGTGEAVTSLLENKGVPGMVQRTLVRPPVTQLGPITDDERTAIMATSPLGLKYNQVIDRESAFEILSRRAEEAAAEAEKAKAVDDLFKMEGGSARSRGYSAPQIKAAQQTSIAEDLVGTLGKTLTRQVTNQASRAIIRGVLGSLFRGR